MPTAIVPCVVKAFKNGETKFYVWFKETHLVLSSVQYLELKRRQKKIKKIAFKKIIANENR